MLAAGGDGTAGPEQEADSARGHPARAISYGKLNPTKLRCLYPNSLLKLTKLRSKRPFLMVLKRHKEDSECGDDFTSISTADREGRQTGSRFCVK